MSSHVRAADATIGAGRKRKDMTSPTSLAPNLLLGPSVLGRRRLATTGSLLGAWRTSFSRGGPSWGSGGTRTGPSPITNSRARFCRVRARSRRARTPRCPICLKRRGLVFLAWSIPPNSLVGFGCEAALTQWEGSTRGWRRALTVKLDSKSLPYGRETGEMARLSKMNLIRKARHANFSSSLWVRPFTESLMEVFWVRTQSFDVAFALQW